MPGSQMIISDTLVIHQDVHMLSSVARGANPEDETSILVILNRAIKLMQRKGKK